MDGWMDGFTIGYWCCHIGVPCLTSITKTHTPPKPSGIWRERSFPKQARILKFKTGLCLYESNFTHDATRLLHICKQHFLFKTLQKFNMLILFATRAALYLHISPSNSPSCHSERSTRQCARIWSDNLQIMKANSLMLSTRFQDADFPSPAIDGIEWLHYVMYSMCTIL